jgi:hypothetical protein
VTAEWVDSIYTLDTLAPFGGSDTLCSVTNVHLP